jgi:hypothetical protein
MRQQLLILVMILLAFYVSCDDNRSEYDRLVQRELNKEVRYDSLFLGYEFGMLRQDFLNHSWNLNQQKIVTGGVQIHYKLEDLAATATMVFYPDFKEDRVYRMPVEISYDAWAIWNREYHSDSLIVDLIDKFENDYGPGFIHTMHPDLDREAWIKVDGNRRITMYPKDDRIVRVEFLDLTAELK